MILTRTFSIVLLASALLLAGCIPERDSRSLAQAQEAKWRQFFTAVESRQGIPTSWSEVSAEAKSYGIGDTVTMADWFAILRVAKESGLTSRAVVQLHPMVKDRAFFGVMVDVLGYDSDLFTRARVYDMMVRQYPEAPETPRYGLHLLLDAWSGQWPDGINLHGNSPRDGVSLIVARQWQLQTTEPINPEVCADLLTQQEKWHFDRSKNKWTVAK